MRNKRKKDYFNDNLFKSFLSNYRSEKLSKETDLKIERIVDNYYKKDSEKRGFNIFSPILALSFTIIILLVFSYIFIQFIFFNVLNNRVLISHYSDDIKEVKLATTNVKLNTKQDSPLKLQTEQALFIVKGESRFVIKKEKNFLVFKNKDKNDYYYLKSGAVYIDADNLAKNEKLEINIIYGKVLVKGTKFEIISKKQELNIKCFEGEVIFKTYNNETKEEFILKEGTELLLEKDKITNKISFIEKQIIEKENQYFILKRDVFDNITEKRKTIKVFEINVDQKDAEIYINNKLYGYGNVRYLFNKNEKINLNIKLDGFEEITKSFLLTNSNKVIYKLQSKELKIDRHKFIEWQIKIKKDKYKNILILKNYIALISEKDINIYNKGNGKKISSLKINNNQDHFVSFENNIAFYEAPGKVKIIRLPKLNIIYETVTGQIAFGDLGFNEKYLIVASADHNLYIYNYIEKKFVKKHTFQSGFYCSPLIVDDKVILSNLEKKVIVYSLVNNSILWEKKNKNRFYFTKPAVNQKNNHFAVTDEKSNTFVYKLIDGSLLFTVKSDKAITPLFINNNILVFNNNTLNLYNRDGKNILKVNSDDNLKGFFNLNDMIYFIFSDFVGFYDKNDKKIKKLNEINIKNNSLYNYYNDELIVLSKDNMLTFIKL